MLTSVYLHIPFCTTKCTYCAFNTYTHLEALVPDFVRALAQEIALTGALSPERVQVGTVFFGGGTPSLLTAEQFAFLFEALNAAYDIVPDAEITLEANPNDLSETYLRALHEIGFNRLSMGMQSAVESELKLFARRHDHAVVRRIWPEVRASGFDNVNVDLIYGIPDQTLESWRYTLEETITLAPEHLSLYALGLEDGTPLKEWVEEGRVATPDDDLAADMYDLATEMLGAAGYVQYEISNWARPGFECRHNLQYWLNEPYLGLGPGAHGWAGGVRYATELSPQRYIRALNNSVSTETYAYPRTPATRDEVIVEREDEMGETLMMTLRLTERGVILDEFEARFGVDLRDHRREAIAEHVRNGLLELTPERLRLTSAGRMLSNRVLRDMI
jgi:oxygen-independent coproporphyrinogen-3 oxidase